MSYVLIVHSKEVRGMKNSLMTKKGEPFWVLRDTEGWVPATSVRYRETDNVPKDIKIFGTPEEAVAFAKTWGGHPWWCEPDHVHFEVVKVKTRYKQVFDGYDIDNEDVPLS